MEDGVRVLTPLYRLVSPPFFLSKDVSRPFVYDDFDEYEISLWVDSPYAWPGPFSSMLEGKVRKC